MGITLVGINHKTAPIGIREKTGISKKMLSTVFDRFLNSMNIEGIVVLSTCNRTEFYVSSKDVGPEKLLYFIIKYFNLDNADGKYFYTLCGIDVVKHLFYVTCGLDSQILGETEILGQVKDAYSFAHYEGRTDKLTNKLFLKSIEVGKKVRTQTKISQGNISYGSVIFNIIKNFFDTIESRNVIVIGTGQMASLVLKYLKNKKTNVTVVSNKHFNVAKNLAAELNGKAITIDKLKCSIESADIIISSTSAPHLILKKSDFKTRTSRKPLLIFDLAVPRDVDPHTRDIKNVYLYDIDDLTFQIEKNIEMRKREVDTVIRIIEEEVLKFAGELKCLENYELAQEIVN